MGAAIASGRDTYAPPQSVPYRRIRTSVANRSRYSLKDIAAGLPRPTDEPVENVFERYGCPTTELLTIRSNAVLPDDWDGAMVDPNGISADQNGACADPGEFRNDPEPPELPDLPHSTARNLTDLGEPPEVARQIPVDLLNYPETSVGTRGEAAGGGQRAPGAFVAELTNHDEETHHDPDTMPSIETNKPLVRHLTDDVTEFENRVTDQQPRQGVNAGWDNPDSC